MRASAASIDSVDIVDPKTVKITLKHPDGAILENLAMFVPSIIDQSVYEAVGDEAYGTAPVGSGPFMVKSFNRGQSLELVRNPYYWKPGQPYLDGVTFSFVPDDNTRILQLQNNEADVAAEVPYSQVAQLDAADGIKVQVEDILTWDALWLNNLKKPFDEPAVRQALAYATPREDMLASVLFGNAEVANSIIAKGKYWSADVPGLHLRHPEGEGAAGHLLGAQRVPDGAHHRGRRHRGAPGGRDHQGGLEPDRGRPDHPPGGYHVHLRRVVRGQGRRGDLPGQHPVERHALGRQPRPGVLRPGRGRQLVRHRLLQPGGDGHPQGRQPEPGRDASVRPTSRGCRP